MKVDGPIQYDVAIDCMVADKKVPDSEVSGKARFFIFPDLNRGNNTYKQCSVHREQWEFMLLWNILLRYHRLLFLILLFTRAFLNTSIFIGFPMLSIRNIRSDVMVSMVHLIDMLHSRGMY
jgi:hypothetical protein